MTFDLHALAESSRVLLQGGLLLLIVSTPLLGVALILARHLRRQGTPSLAAVVLRAAVVCLIAAPLLLTLGSLAPSRENGDADFAHRHQPSSLPLTTAPPSAIALSNSTYTASRFPAEPVNFSSWYIAGAGAWLSVSLLLLIGLGCSHAYLRLLRRDAIPVSPESDAAHAFAAVTRTSEAPTLLLAHPRVTVPFAVAGMFGRPGMIFLPPQDAPSEGIPENMLPAVLAHEQAHLRRGDFGWNLTARIVGTLL